MKKNVAKLALNKSAVSKLDHLKGGLAAGPIAAGTNMWSGCHACDSVRRTQCKGDACPNFSVGCPDKPMPVGI